MTVARSSASEAFTGAGMSASIPCSTREEAIASLLRDRLSTAYSISFDLARSYVVSQGIVGSYMAQCCGVQAEYQQFSYPSGFGLPQPTDRRINVSFVLAGLGTFSNFFGAFGGL